MKKVQDLSSLKCELIYPGYVSLFTCCNCLKKKKKKKALKNILLKKKKKKKKKKKIVLGHLFLISWFRDKNVPTTWKKWPMSTFSLSIQLKYMFFLILSADCLQMTLSFLSRSSVTWLPNMVSALWSPEISLTIAELPFLQSETGRCFAV